MPSERFYLERIPLNPALKERAKALRQAGRRPEQSEYARPVADPSDSE